MIGRKFISSVIVCLLWVAGPTFAHHAGQNFDRAHPITVSGTVTAYVYTNPHVRIDFNVTEPNGTISKWSAEMGPPHGMYRAGWNRESLKPGDPITVKGFPSKDGKKWLDTLNLVGPRGLVLNIGPRKPEGK